MATIMAVEIGRRVTRDKVSRHGPELGTRREENEAHLRPRKCSVARVTPVPEEGTPLAGSQSST